MTPLLDFDLNLLRHLDLLLDEGSVSRAAARAGLTQSAMSRALARLREALDDPLLVPVGRGMARTPRAEALRPVVRGLLRDLRERVLEPARFDPATTERTFTLSSTDYTDAVLVPGVYRRLAREAPGARLDLVGPAAAFGQGLAEGAVDLVVGIPGGDAATLRARPLFTDGWACLVPEGVTELPLEAWLARPHVVVGTNPRVRGAVDRAVEAAGATRRVGARVHTFGLVAEVVRATGWIATLPARVAHAHARDGLRALPCPLALAPLTLSMVWHERAHHDPAVQWLRGVLLEVAAEA